MDHPELVMAQKLSPLILGQVIIEQLEPDQLDRLLMLSKKPGKDPVEILARFTIVLGKYFMIHPHRFGTCNSIEQIIRSRSGVPNHHHSSVIGVPKEQSVVILEHLCYL
jgi:hypothetical protein